MKGTNYRMQQLKVWPNFQDGFVLTTSQLPPQSLLFLPLSSVKRLAFSLSQVCWFRAFWLSGQQLWVVAIELQAWSRRLLGHKVMWSMFPLWLRISSARPPGCSRSSLFNWSGTFLPERWFFSPRLFFYLQISFPFRANVRFHDIWTSPLNTCNIHCVYPFRAAAQGVVRRFTSGKLKQWKQMGNVKFCSVVERGICLLTPSKLLIIGWIIV